MNFRDFSIDFFRFLRNLKKSIEKSKTKWVLKMINNAPFWTGISRICRSRSPLQIREIPAQNGAFLSIFRTHFDWQGFFERFFSISPKSQKIARKIKKNRKMWFFNKYDKNRNGSWKWPKMLRFEPEFHGIVEEVDIYKSVKSLLKTEPYWSFSRPISFFFIDFSSDFLRFRRNRKKSLEKSHAIETGFENDQKCSVLSRNFTDL